MEKDIIKTTGSLQVCEGQEAGIEPGIHSMNDMYS